MRVILCSVSLDDELKRTLIAALLNAAKSNTYPVNDLDVKAIQAGVAAVPTYPLEIPARDAHVIEFFTHTW
jgi:hypothetical protein